MSSEVEALEKQLSAAKSEVSRLERELVAAKARAAQAQTSRRKLECLPPDHPVVLETARAAVSL